MKEVTPGFATSVLEEGPLASNRLQLPVLEAGTLNVAEACSDGTIVGPILVGSTTPHPSTLFTEDALLVTATCEPELSPCGLGPTLHDPISLPVTLTTVTEHTNASVSFKLQEFDTASPPSQGTPDVVTSGSSDWRTDSHPGVAAQGQSDVPEPTFSNPPSAHVPERVRSVHTLHPNRSNDLPPSRLMFGDVPLDEASRSTSTGGDQELGTPYLDTYTSQLSATIVDAAPPQTSPMVHTLVTESTPPEPPEPTRELRHESPLTATGSEEDILDYLLHTSETPDATHVTGQAGGPVELHPHPVPHVLPQTSERSILPTVKDSTEVVKDPVALHIEDLVALPTKGPTTPPVEASAPPVTDNPGGAPIVHSNEELNSISTEELIVPATEDPVVPLIGESIPSNIEDSVVLAKPLNPFVAKEPNPQVIEESITPQFAITLTDNPQPRSHSRVVDVTVGTLDAVDTSETKETTPSASQQQDDEDELIVDAILALHPDLDSIPQPSRDTELDNVPTQEKDKNYTHTPLPEVAAAGPSDAEADLTPGPSNIVIDTPSIGQRSRPGPILPQESVLPEDAGGVTAEVPPPVEPITQGSVANPSGSHSVFKSIWSGALLEFTIAKKNLQHVFTTPRRPSPSPPADGSPNIAQSSPITEEGGFWNLNTEATQGESRTDFVRACMTGHSSPVDSQELPHSADLRRRLSLQQGTGTLLVPFVYVFYLQ